MRRRSVGLRGALLTIRTEIEPFYPTSREPPALHREEMAR